MFLRKIRHCGIVLPGLILLLALLSSPVKAANGVIVLNEVHSVTLGRGQSVTYTFTPAETGDYVFWMDQAGDAGTSWLCWSLEGAVGTEYYQAGYQAEMYALEAGKAYTVKLWHGDGKTLTHHFGIRPASAATSMSFEKTTVSEYRGQTIRLYLQLSSPEAVAGTFSYTSSNSSVAVIKDHNQTFVELQLKKAGTATVTASNGSISCSCTVTVLENGVLTMDTPSYIMNPKEGIHYFTFTPGTSGKYVVYTNQSIPIVTELYHTEQLVYKDGQAVACELTAGRTFTFGIVVSKTVEESGIEKIPVCVELYDAHFVPEPDDNTGGEEEGSDDPEDPEEDIPLWELEQEYHIHNSENRQYARYTATADETYYFYVSGDQPQEWYITCEGELCYPLNEYWGAEGDRENVYHFDAGKTYDIMCGTGGLSFHIIKLSANPVLVQGENESGGTDSDHSGTETEVDKEQFSDVAKLIAPGSILVITDRSTESIPFKRDALQTAANRNLTVKIAVSTGEITFDPQTLRTIAQNLQGQDAVIALTAPPTADLSTAQQQLLSQYQVNAILHAEITDGTERLHYFNGGTAVVRLPFEPRAGAFYGVIYVAEDGNIEKMATHRGEDFISFTTGHFSVFAVVELDEAGNFLEPGDRQDAPQDSKPDGILLGVIGGVAILAALVAVLLIKRNRK